VGAELGSDLLETVASARGWLEQRSVNPVEVLELEDLGSWVGTVLGEASVHGHAVSIELRGQSVQQLIRPSASAPC
jgi:hypothetical protein